MKRQQRQGKNSETWVADVYGKVLQRLPRLSGMSPADREDIVQDACVRVLNKRSKQKIRDEMWYLLRVARNLIIDRHRTRTRRGNLFVAEDDRHEIGSSVLDPERVLSGRERLEVIRYAIEKLPPRCAEALRLHRFGGLSYPAIAREMGISCSMVEKHISEALLRLERALNEADGTRTPLYEVG